LTDAAAAHFGRVVELLKAAEIPYERDRRLVRGLDYYTGTIFEYTTGSLGAQDAILGGGRYDNLVEELGGASTPAIGFAAGVERLALLLAVGEGKKRGPDLYIMPMGELEREAFELAGSVRGVGKLRVEVDVAGGKLKQQFKRADRANARFALVLGENELGENRAELKDLGTGASEAVDLEPAEIAKRILS
jgi:histidyl-tRNA synthetase